MRLSEAGDVGQIGTAQGTSLRWRRVPHPAWPGENDAPSFSFANAPSGSRLVLGLLSWSADCHLREGMQHWWTLTA